MQLLLYTATFILIALASKKIGDLFSRVGLPYITGYLFTGALAGPFILNLLPAESTTTLRYIDELSLGIIAFVAGSELYLKEIRSRIKSISWITSGVVLVALPLGAISLFFLTNLLPFAEGMTVMDRVAIAILGATILLALSPASTIAVIKEVRAKGSFSHTVLGVTVTMDVVIIVLFAVAVAVAGALLQGAGLNAGFALLLLIDLGAALVAGYVVGKLLQGLLGLSIDPRLKMAGVLLLGYLIFLVGHWIIELSYTHLPIEIHIEPLLVAMIGGFMVTNYTVHRERFAGILHDVGPMVYVAFFTLTGITIKLDILAQTWPIALALFATRCIGILFGSYAGSFFAGEEAHMRRNAWLGLVTQAGIALGLAREVATEFPGLGDAFATMVISVVVLNEIFGPLMLKFALKRTGEAADSADARDQVRDAVILGIEPQSLTLARQLQAVNWQVIMADTNQEHVERLAAADVDERHIPTVDDEVLSALITGRTDAVVVLLENDDDNLRVAEWAYRKGVPRLIVRPQTLRYARRFTDMGALILDQTSAMVHLMEQSVRSPQSAAVLLHQDSGRSVVQVTVSNPSLDGMLVRDLRLPDDVLLIDVTRKGVAVAPNGYTRLHMHDDITLIGKEESLDEAIWRMGY